MSSQLAGALLIVALFSACSGSDDATDLVADETADVSLTTVQQGSAEELFPDVVDVVATQDGDGTWTFSVTMSSPYDSAARYADAWRVIGEDGTEYGIRELAHDHAAEQPFNRSQGGIAIPDEIKTVIVEGRDQVSGWGGGRQEVQLER